MPDPDHIYYGGLSVGDTGHVRVWVDDGDTRVDFHVLISAPGGNSSMYQQLSVEEAFELSGALREAAERARAQVHQTGAAV